MKVGKMLGIFTVAYLMFIACAGDTESMVRIKLAITIVYSIVWGIILYRGIGFFMEHGNDPNYLYLYDKDARKRKEQKEREELKKKQTAEDIEKQKEDNKALYTLLFSTVLGVSLALIIYSLF